MIYNKRIYGVVREININELKEIFDKFEYIKIALLFGSRSKNNFNAKSDYDFACLFDESILLKILRDRSYMNIYDFLIEKPEYNEVLLKRIANYSF